MSDTSMTDAPTTGAPTMGASATDAPAADAPTTADRPFTSLVALRNNPIWEHRWMFDQDQVPALPSEFYTIRTFPIHPLWRWRAWRLDYVLDRNDMNREVSLAILDAPALDCPAETYSRLQPALQLATIYLSKAAPLLMRFAIGPLRRYPDDRDGAYHLDPMWNPSADDEATFDQWLLDFCDQYRMTLLIPSTQDPQGGGAIMGLTTQAHGFQGGENALLCAVASDLLDEITDDSWLRKSSVAQATCLVLLAEILIHELGHAVWAHRAFQHFQPAYVAAPTRQESDEVYHSVRHMLRPEPRVWPEEFEELGWATESFLHGCDLRQPWRYQKPPRLPANVPIYDGSWGMLAHFSGREHRDNFFYPVTLSTIISLFDKHTWEAPKMTLSFWPEQGTSALNGYRRRGSSIGRTTLTPIEDYWRNLFASGLSTRLLVATARPSGVGPAGATPSGVGPTGAQPP